MVAHHCEALQGYLPRVIYFSRALVSIRIVKSWARLSSFLILSMLHPLRPLKDTLVE